MRLLIVTQKVNKNDPILGFFHRWIIEFAKHCESIVVICLEEGMHELPANVRVLSLGKDAQKGGPTEVVQSSVDSHQSTVMRRLGYIFRFYKYIWQERGNYDVVFVHMNPIYVVLGGILWYILRKKVSLWYTHKQVDLKLRVAEKLVNKIFTASRESFRLASAKVVVMGHGIDTDYFVPRTSDREGDMCRIVTIGRVAPVKNIHIMIDAVATLRKEGKNVTLTIVGEPVTDGDRVYATTLEKSVTMQDIDTLITWVGAVPPDAIIPYLQDANIFINMSDTGSLDKAVLEALACELPVISSNSAFRDILEPHGFFVREQTVDACVETLRPLIGRDLSAASASLRRYVISEHSLDRLVVLLITHLHS